MGLGSAAATIGCSTDKFTEKWNPWVKPVPGMIPRKPWHYPTTTRECGVNGLWVKTLGGRAVKADGNPNHPLTKGKLGARQQAVLQGLYHQDRVKKPMLDGKEISWEEAHNVLVEKLSKAKGGGVSALTGPVWGINRDIWAAFVAAHGSGKHVQFDIFTKNAQREASERVFGRREVPFFSLKGTDCIVSFGAAFLETWGDPISQQRDYADFKSDFEHRGKHFQFEPKRTMTGANADRWGAVRPGSETLLALAMLQALVNDSNHLSEEEKALVGQLTASVNREDALSQSGLSAKKFDAALDALKHAHHGVVLPAADLSLGNDAQFHHVAVLLLNKALGAIGKQVNFDAGNPGDQQITHRATLDLLQDLQAGKVDLLVLEDANPVYSLPASFNVAESIKKAGFVVAFAEIMNETVAAANLVIPAAHDLESWGEVMPVQGVHMLIQPVMTARWELVQAEDVLLEQIEAATPGTFKATRVQDLVKAKWLETYATDSLDKEKAWRDFLKAGGKFELKTEGETLAISANLTGDFFNGFKPTVVSGKALMVIESTRFGDGYTANRDWLQELPDTMTGVVWDSWLEVSRETAKKEGWSIGQVVKVAANGHEVECPVMITDTIATDVFCLETGQGHANYGKVYNRGVNAFGFFGKQAQAWGDLSMGPMAAKATVTAKTHRLATVSIPGKGDRLTQPLSKSKHDVDTPIYGGEAYDRDIYQWSTLEELHGGGHGHGHGPDKTDPEYLKSEWPVHKEKNFYKDRTETPVVVGRPETFYDDYKWEMGIDLNRCNGCGACTVACYSENNLNVVGKDQVQKGRIMSWLRINRYITFHNEEDQVETKVHFMPLGCQQCASAPCETVCPSLATYHTKEGLNAMVYNRCVGTRYCANNCSYKARRFNWFDSMFAEDQAWQLNPEVSVRSRGVMEKCTFCIQRINTAKTTARNEERKVRDGEFQTACQQACPADAIVFGNASDPESKISKLAKDHRGYKALDHHLQTKPGVTYLKKIDISGNGHHG